MRYVPIGTTTLGSLITSIGRADAFIAILEKELKKDGVMFNGDHNALKENFESGHLKIDKKEF